MARTKKAAAEVAVEEFTPDALVIRTCDPGGVSYGGFQWPMTVGEIVTCPDWDDAPKCGNGLHGLLDGIGNWSLTARDNAVWQVIGVKRAECVSIDSDKVKFQRGRVEYVGGFAGAMLMVQQATVDKLIEMAKGNAATGDSGHAAATGDSGHAAATGYRGHAAATGYRGHAAATGHRGHAAATGYMGHAAAIGYMGHAAATGRRGHAAATGDSGHAAATGYMGHAAATGDGGHAAATGDGGHAAATGDSGHAAVAGQHSIAASLGWNGTAEAGADGAIVLAYVNNEGELQHVFASKVGENGIEAGKTYRLNANGRPEVV